MFETKPQDLAITLTQMERQSRERYKLRSSGSENQMAEWISQDRRFDAFDPMRLVERVQHCRSNGAVFDVEDPSLRKGGQKRPLDRSQY